MAELLLLFLGAVIFDAARHHDWWTVVGIALMISVSRG